MNKSFSRVSNFMERSNPRNRWLDEDEENQRQEFISGLFGKKTPKKRQRIASVHDSDFSDASEDARLGESHNHSCVEEHQEEPKQEEPRDSDCEGDSEFESFFEPSSHVSDDPWPEKPASVKPVPTSVQISDVPMTFKPMSESKELTGGDASASANSKRRDVCIKSILRSMRRYYCAKLETMTPYLRKEKKIKLKHQTLIK